MLVFGRKISFISSHHFSSYILFPFYILKTSYDFTPVCVAFKLHSFTSISVHTKYVLFVLSCRHHCCRMV